VADHSLGTILLVDDTIENFEVLDDMLSEKDYETRSAMGGLLALRKV